MNISEGLNYLIGEFGVEHDVRFVPSVIVGGGFMYRCTVSNLPHSLDANYSSKASSYENALYCVIDQIKKAKSISEGTI